MAEISFNNTHSILRISDEKTLQLVELYEKEECLWNTMLPEYKQKAPRKEASERIAKILDVPLFTGRHVITKFKNLRNSYCQELRKITNRVDYKPKVFWFWKMDAFLRPHVNQSSRDFRVRANKSSNHEEKNNHEIELWTQQSNPDDVFFDENSDSDNVEKFLKRSRTSSISSKRLKVEDNSDTGEYYSPQIEPKDNSNRDEAFNLFGKYVSAMLKTMPEQKALEIQPMIVSLLVSGVASTSEERITQSDDVNYT